MCGIFGASFAPDSNVSRRRLMKALLSESEVRGTDAAGFAWYGADASDGVFKKDVRGSNLSVSTLPHDAVSFIGHTRNSTHGDPRDNENNHPIISNSGDIRLVHNGVITNHREVRTALGKDGKKLPDVDSSVIPAVIEMFGIEHTSMLRGYAACAWFDRETAGTIHLARFESSPVALATLVDGSIVFASTPAILSKALRTLGLQWIGNYPDTFMSLEDGDYLQLLDGEYVSEAEVTFGEYDYRGASYHTTTSGQSGGWASQAKAVTATPTTTNPGKQPVNPTPAKGSEDTPMALDQGPKFPAKHPDETSSVPRVLFSAETIADPEDTPEGVSPYGWDASIGWSQEDYAHWLITGEEPDDRAEREDQELLASPSDEDLLLGEELLSDEDYDDWVRSGLSPEQWTAEREALSSAGDPDYPTFERGDAGNTVPLFYSRSHDGDYQDYTTLDTLLSALRWHAGLSGSEELLVGPEEGELRWINHFEDIGYISDDPEGDIEFSWVHSPSNMEPYSDMLPGYVKDGVSKLHSMVGV